MMCCKYIKMIIMVIYYYISIIIIKEVVEEIIIGLVPHTDLTKYLCPRKRKNV